MRLAITLGIAQAILRFTTPGAGTYYVGSFLPGSDVVRIEASNHVEEGCNVAVALPREPGGRFYRVWWLGQGQVVLGGEGL